MSGDTDFNASPHHQGGFMFLVPMFLALAVGMTALAWVPRYFDQVATERDIELAASQMAQLNAATEGYVMKNTASLISQAGTGSPHEIRLSDLISAGMLPPGYQPVNPWGQQYRFFAYRISVSGADDGLRVLTVGQGGQPGGNPARNLSDGEKRLANITVPKTAAAIGVNGGFMASGSYPGGVGIQGANGIWSFSPGRSLPFTPGPGALASMQYFTGGSLNNSYLYRVSVPGRPELNRMSTALDMDGNDIAGVGSMDMRGNISASGDQLSADGDVLMAERGNITLRDGTLNSGDVVIDDVRIQGGAVPVSRGVYDMRTVAPNSRVPKPSCPAGASPQIFLAVGGLPLSAANGIETTGGLRGGNLLAARARAADVGGAWDVYLEANIDDSWYRLASSEGALQVAPKCT